MSSANTKYFQKGPTLKDNENRGSLKLTLNKEEKSLIEQTDLNSGSTLGYMNEKIKYLEIENNQLKKEILLNMNEKSKLEYYIRIRKDLLEEIEKMKSEKNLSEQILTSKYEKLEEELEKLNAKLKSNNSNFNQINQNSQNLNFISNTGTALEEPFSSTRQLENFKEENKNNPSLVNLMSSSSLLNTNKKLSILNRDPKISGISNTYSSSNVKNINNLKYFSNLGLDSDNEISQNMSDFNFYNVESSSAQFNQKQAQDKETMGFNSNIYQNNMINNQDDNTNQNNINSNSTSLTANPFVSIVNEMEERIKVLEDKNKQKENEIQELKTKHEMEKNNILSQKDKIEKEFENLNLNFITAISTKKTCSEELKEISEQNFYNLRRDKDNIIHDLEKKIISLEKLNSKHLCDIEQLISLNSQSDVSKQNQIEALKNSLKFLILEYEAIYKSYEENLKTLVKQVDSLKQLYMARENEFLNITAYYTKTINEYAAPIYELNAQTKIKKWEEMYYEQIKELDELRKNLENSIRENNQLRAECIDSKPKIRQRINEALTSYENKLTEIAQTHNNLLEKLKKLFSYMEFFDTKFSFFNSLIEDNKRLMEQLTLSECNYKSISTENFKVEIIRLKDSNIKLTNELEMKNNLLRDYESLFDQIKSPPMSPKGGEMSVNNGVMMKKKAQFVNDEIIVKLNSEISLLSNQIANLNKTRTSVENFYQTELKKLAENLQEKNDKIEELKGVVRKIENDFIAKKETVYNLWILEFKEFKENLITLTDIKNIVDKFKTEGEDLNSHKKQILNEEIFLARQEVAKKDETFTSQKKNFDNEIKETRDLLESYKKNFTQKLESLDKLVKMREIEFGALMSEKEKLIKIEENKKKITENEIVGWNEQKEQIKIFLNQHSETKNKEISNLKNQIQILQKEIEDIKKFNEKNLANILSSVESQIDILKDREIFNLKQMQNSEEKYRAYKEEKDRSIALFRNEIKNLKKNNEDLAKVSHI